MRKLALFEAISTVRRGGPQRTMHSHQFLAHKVGYCPHYGACVSVLELTRKERGRGQVTGFHQFREKLS